MNRFVVFVLTALATVAVSSAGQSQWHQQPAASAPAPAVDPNHWNPLWNAGASASASAYDDGQWKPDTYSKSHYESSDDGQWKPDTYSHQAPVAYAASAPAPAVDPNHWNPLWNAGASAYANAYDDGQWKQWSHESSDDGQWKPDSYYKSHAAPVAPAPVTYAASEPAPAVDPNHWNPLWNAKATAYASAYDDGQWKKWSTGPTYKSYPTPAAASEPAPAVDPNHWNPLWNAGASPAATYASPAATYVSGQWNQWNSAPAPVVPTLYSVNHAAGKVNLNRSPLGYSYSYTQK